MDINNAVIAKVLIQKFSCTVFILIDDKNGTKTHPQARELNVVCNEHQAACICACAFVCDCMICMCMNLCVYTYLYPPDIFDTCTGTGQASMFSLIIPPKDQVSRVNKMLGDKFGTASKSNHESIGHINVANNRVDCANLLLFCC